MSGPVPLCEGSYEEIHFTTISPKKIKKKVVEITNYIHNLAIKGHPFHKEIYFIITFIIQLQISNNTFILEVVYYFHKLRSNDLSFW